MFTVLFNVYVSVSSLVPSFQNSILWILQQKLKVSTAFPSHSWSSFVCCVCVRRGVCVCGGKMRRRQRQELMTTRQSTLSALTASHRAHWGWCHPCQPPAVDLTEKLALLKNLKKKVFYLLFSCGNRKKSTSVGLITSLFAYFMICHVDFTQSYVLKFFSTSKQQLSFWAHKLKFLLGNHWEQKLLCFE